MGSIENLIANLEKFEGYEILAKTYGRQYRIRVWYLLDGMNVPAGVCSEYCSDIFEAYNSVMFRYENKIKG